MWNNYTVELQNPGRIEDHLEEARVNAIEAEARAADPLSTPLAVAARRAAGAASARLSAARHALIGRVGAARRHAGAAARSLRHPHLHWPVFGHHRP
jgi:hypothetical protein